MSNSSDIFSRLDDIFTAPERSTAAVAPLTTFNSGIAKSIAALTSNEEYHQLTAKWNITSHSKLEKFHKCPRLYELEGLRAATLKEGFEEAEVSGTPNVDFAFGHAVGAGIQTYGATGSLVAAQFAAFLSWRIPYELEKLDKSGRPTGKSLALSLFAVEKFSYFAESELFQEWEVLLLPNGKPAVEVEFAVDTQNGFYHFGHIDAILQHRESKRLGVWEGKTTGMASVSEAAYGNSYQALGYSVVLDAISRRLGLPLSDYDVIYVVYSSKDRQFQLLPFTKNRVQRAEWLQDLLITHALVQQYRELKFFPKRGESCINKWGKECEWYGSCQMRNSSLFPKVEPGTADDLDRIRRSDFFFTLDELVAAQKEEEAEVRV